MCKDLQLPSDFLIDNHKSLSKRRDFEDLCESLDDLQHEAMNLAFQDGFNQGELNTLRQFVEGKLDRDYILEFLKSEDVKTTQYEFRFKGDTQ